jgi:hypothetical protein
MKYLNFNYLSKKPTKFYRFTGLKVGEFLILKEEIEPFWQKAEIKRLSRPNRQRAIGGGRKYHLKLLEDKMLLVFLFYRLYLNYDFPGFIFGFDGTNAARLIKRVEPVLAKRFKLPSIKRLSQKRISSLEEFREAYPDLYEVIIGDATEQEIPRPKDKRKKRKILFWQEEKADRQNSAFH